ncbi:MAG: carboxypeptidase regulatory-like domain-containing protein [Gemmatimonadaceae bacterium]
MVSSSFYRLLAAVPASLLLHPLVAPAQEVGVITGMVAGTNSSPLARARVAIAGTSISAATDATGSFRVFGVPVGMQTIEVRMLGYAPLSLPVEVVAGESFHLALEMLREATVLPAVEIAAEPRVNPLYQGFLDRQARGLGSFFDRKDIEAIQPRLLTDVLRRVPGLRLEPAGESYGAGNRVQSSRSSGSGGERICPMEFYVNGTPMPLPRDGGGINHFVTPEEVVGVEVYNGASQIPPQFNSGMYNTRCGVVVIWTRSGPEPRSAPARRRR